VKIPIAFTPKLLTVIREGYSKQQFIRDFTAGVIVAAVAIPLAIAFGIASGVTPEKGLITAIIAGFIGSALGGSRVQISGPTGAFVVVIFGVVSKFGVAGLTVATVVAGLLVIVMGLVKMGGVIKFIPAPVITGFTSGIAVIIFSTQIKDLLGLHMAQVPSEFVDKWGAYIGHLSSIDIYAVGVALVTLLIVIYGPRLTTKVPSPLIALLVTTIVVQLAGIHVETIGSKFGAISGSLPAPVVPEMTYAAIKELIPSIITIAILIAVESLLSAVVADGMMGTKHRSNMELVAQGSANVFSGLFGGIPATGAIARTATNIKSGGTTPVAGIVHALIVLLVLVALGGYASMIPMATLAGLLVVVAYNMSEWRTFRSMLKAPKSDIAILVSTFLLTVLVDLTIAIEYGMILAAFLFMHRMATVTNVSVITNELKDDDSSDAGSAITLPKGVLMYEINGPFFFGAAEKFSETIRSTGVYPKVLIVRMRNVPAIDATGIHALQDIHKKLSAKGSTLILADIHSQPYIASENAGLLGALGEANIHGNLSGAIERARELVADHTS
jgi:SulP family sulfate permease